MSKAQDENDRLRLGTLPEDPYQDGTVTAAEDVPHIETVRHLLERSYKTSTSKNKIAYGTSGHSGLDEVTGGLRPGDVWLVGADTGFGKSSFAIMLADENIKRGKTVLIVSAEDSASTYGDRLMRRRAQVNAGRMRHKKLRPDELDRMACVLACAEPLPVFIDARGKTVEWLAPHCKRAINEYNVDVVIFDYVGAFAGKLKQQDRRNMVHYIARVLTDVAKTAKPGGICGVLLSQLTHSDEESVPGKYSIRDSKDLTQMSEVTLIGYRAPKDVEVNGEFRAAKGDRMFKVAKVKEGPTGGSVRMSWNEETASFETVIETPRGEPGQNYDELTDGFDNFKDGKY